MILRWAGVVLPGGQTQMLLRETDVDEYEREVLRGELMETYPY